MFHAVQTSKQVYDAGLLAVDAKLLFWQFDPWHKSGEWGREICNHELVSFAPSERLLPVAPTLLLLAVTVGIYSLVRWKKLAWVSVAGS